jgi:O-succinylbenzoic acid--CoA ligase
MVISDCPVRTQARGNPTGLALVAADHRWTWSELDDAVSRVAGQLRERSFGPGERIAVLAANHPATLLLLFAARRTGAALVPLNVRLAPPELRAQVGRVRPRLLLADAERMGALAGAELLEPWAEPATARAPEPSAEPVDPERDWALLFTSGSSGAPKVARLPVRAFEALARAAAANLGSRPDDRWLCNLPLFHVGGLGMAVRCAHDGATLLLHSRFDAEAVVRATQEQGVTHLSLVARTLEQCLDAGLRRGRLRGILVGGGPVPPAVVDRARHAGLPVLLTYGLTEACSQVTTERPREADGRTAGAPLPGLEVRIVGPDRQPVPEGEEGGIAVHGATLMTGYLDDDGATTEVLREGWLLTGDIGRLDARGRLTVLARRTDLILSGGENVYPAEVEAVLVTHPAVAEVAVVGRPDPRWGQVPVAVVVPRPSASPAELRELLAWAGARLAPFKVPAEVLPASALPRTAAGKVDRAAVQAAVTAPSGPCSFEKPRSPEGAAGEMKFK